MIDFFAGFRALLVGFKVVVFGSAAHLDYGVDLKEGLFQLVGDCNCPEGHCSHSLPLLAVLLFVNSLNVFRSAFWLIQRSRSNLKANVAEYRSELAAPCSRMRLRMLFERPTYIGLPFS